MKRFEDLTMPLEIKNEALVIFLSEWGDKMRIAPALLRDWLHGGLL